MPTPQSFYLGKDGAYWKEDGSGPYILDDKGAISQGLPRRIFTDSYGDNMRIRVDPAQTSFFAGREFRTFKELNIGAGNTYVVKAVVPINIVLFGLDLVLDNGFVRVGTYIGGTEGGSFSEVLPKFGRNTMSSIPQPPYVSQVVLTAGGTHTGGTELDVLRLLVANASGQSSSVGAEISDERGIGAGTYYFRLLNSGAGTATGVFKARWEERP